MLVASGVLGGVVAAFAPGAEAVPPARSVSGLSGGLPNAQVAASASRTTGGAASLGSSSGVWATEDTVPSRPDDVGSVWTASDVNRPPVAIDDVVRVEVDDIGGGVAVDVTGNDSDPEGATLSIVSVARPNVGSVSIVGGVVLFAPPVGWLGTVTFPYTVGDVEGKESTAHVTITVEESLATRLAAEVLQWEPVTSLAPAFDQSELDTRASTDLVLGTVIQSLYVLRFPLALLGGAVLWSLLLGGLFNLGFVLKGGIPRIVRRTAHNVAVVMVSHGAKLEALSQPDGGTVVWRFGATAHGLEATGRRANGPEGQWMEVETPQGEAWVPALNLTEEVDRAGFVDDPEPVRVLEEFVGRLRTRRDLIDIVSEHGLAIAHHGPVERFTPQQVHLLMEDSTVRTWKGRNPAYPDFRGTFDLAVATSFLDAWDHPERLIVHDSPIVPSTVVPVEFTNFHTISVGADVHGPERLDQSAWILAFTYEGGRARIVGLVKEG